MADQTVPFPVDTVAIRRRLAREDILLPAPPDLDVRAALALLDGVLGREENADVVIDLRDVERCDPAALQVLSGAAAAMQADGLGLTLSHPSPECEAALATLPDEASLRVRRPRAHRPLRHSMRGQVDEI